MLPKRHVNYYFGVDDIEFREAEIKQDKIDKLDAPLIDKSGKPITTVGKIVTLGVKLKSGVECRWDLGKMWKSRSGSEFEVKEILMYPDYQNKLICVTLALEFFNEEENENE